MNILQIGLKEWPFSSGEYEGKNRGGGTGKYCEMLFGALPESVNIFVITRRLGKQKKYEKVENVTTYRYKALNGRRLRHISLAILNSIFSFRIIKKEKIDIIHSHMLVSNIPAIIIGKLIRKPVVIVSHGALYHKYLPEFNNFRRRIERVLERYLYPFATKNIMFCNHDVETYIKITGKDLGNFEVISTGFELNNTTKPEFNFSNRKIKLLFVGRLLKIKAIDKLIIAISKMSSIYKSKILLEIIGEGEEKTNLISLTKSFHLESVIKFHGYIQDPIDYYRKADIFCLVSDTEGQSLALMEAMANYSACIINDFGVPFADDSVITLSKNEPDLIKSKIIELLDNYELIKIFALNGRDEIEKNFSVNIFGEKYHELYKSLLP